MGETNSLQRELLLRVLRSIGEAASSPGVVLLCGGTSAVIEGWREGTIDMDLGYVQEPGGFFESLVQIKAVHDVSVDMVMPTSFVPAMPGSETRHELVQKFGAVEFRHFDFYTQALAKIQRGNARDRLDVRAMVSAGKVEPREFILLFEGIVPELVRFPAIDPARLKLVVKRWMEEDYG